MIVNDKNWLKGAEKKPSDPDPENCVCNETPLYAVKSKASKQVPFFSHDEKFLHRLAMRAFKC